MRMRNSFPPFPPPTGVDKEAAKKTMGGRGRSLGEWAGASKSYHLGVFQSVEWQLPEFQENS